MKYRLPGVYLGNISLDLFMEYMSNEDLGNQEGSNRYYQTNERTENIKISKVSFSLTNGTDAEDYVLYTHETARPEKIKDMIRMYFDDLPLFNETDIDQMPLTITDVDTPTDGFILYDTLGTPSIYGTSAYCSYDDDLKQEYKYMISAESPDGFILNNYQQVISYINDFPSNVMVPIYLYDLRQEQKVKVKEAFIDRDSVNEASLKFIEYTTDPLLPNSITSIKEGELFFGIRSTLNAISLDDKFFFRDSLGRPLKTPQRNSVMDDIENNRKIKNNSIQIKMLDTTNTKSFSGRAGIVTYHNGISFSKYDKYDLKRNFEKVSDLTENLDILFEDLEPNVIKKVEQTGTYDFTTKDLIIKYTDLIKTQSLPKFKAMHTINEGKSLYYIFDVIRGSIPEYRNDDLSISDKETLCLLDVYDNSVILISTNKGKTTHKIDYSLSPDGKYVFRTITKDSKKYYIRLADDENGLTGYLVIPSKNKKVFVNEAEIISDFPFDELGIDVDITDGNIYPISNKNSNDEDVVNEWGMDLQMERNEKLSIVFKDGNTDMINKSAILNTFMDKEVLRDRSYFEMPITLDINSESTNTNLISDVLVTMRAKRVLSANTYDFTKYGFLTQTDNTGDLNNFKIQKPFLEEYDDELNRPFKNISDYISLNNFIDESGVTKKYYLVNEYDQSKMYKVTETLIHEDSEDCTYQNNYEGTFTKISSIIKININDNTISYITAENSSISVDDRGKFVDNDILGIDLIDILRSDFKKGFNKIFYKIDNYAYDSVLGNVDDDGVGFLKNSLIGYDGFNKMLNKFLRNNFVSLNEYIYTIDSSFKMGFFTSQGDRLDSNAKTFNTWEVDEDAYKYSNMNTLQKIRSYEITPSDDDIIKKAKMDWIKKNLLYKNDYKTSTGYKVNRDRPLPAKDVNNKAVLNQAFSSLMDKNYSVAKVITSFSNIDINNLIVLDTKDRDLFSGTQDQVRFINSNQNVKVMIKSYLSGFNKKVGG